MFKTVSPLVANAGQASPCPFDKDSSFSNLLKQEIHQMEHQLSDNPYLADSESDIEEVVMETPPVQKKPSPTELRISTMTAICNLNVALSLKEFFDLLEIEEVDFREHPPASYPHLISAQFGSDHLKGLNLKNKKKNKKTTKKESLKKRKCFQNQITFIVLIHPTKKVNIKLFKNGKIQMTGLKRQEDGIAGTQCVIEKLDQYKDQITSFSLSPGYDPEQRIQNFQIVLINSDFNTNFMIRRERLFEILKKMGLWVSYEPDIYPGVNAKYYWNQSNQSGLKDTKGVCQCGKTCDGSGNGDGDGKCRKITIATFKSGAIIITGARHVQQTNDAYQFINSLFDKYFKYIHRDSNQSLLESITN
jgi:TATA-box binding protein (TBP) (component of TFIID and TFIIIB)